MSDQLQLRRGTTAETQAFTGAEGEATIDTDKHVLVIHDGVNAGGFPTANELTVDKRVILFEDDVSGGSAADAYVLTPEAETIRPDEYVNGMYLSFVTANPNTGAATANFNGLGAKSIKKPDGSDPAAGEVDDRVVVIYDGDNDWLELQLFQPFDPNTVKRNVANVYTAVQTPDSTALSSSSNSVAVDLSADHDFTLGMTENTTLAAPSNVTARQSGCIEITQDASTAYALAYNTFWKFANGDVPAISDTLSSKNLLIYKVSDDGSYANCALKANVS